MNKHDYYSLSATIFAAAMLPKWMRFAGFMAFTIAAVFFFPQ